MSNKIKKLLIANRGEIACRIIRTAQKMNIETFTISSPHDYQNSLHSKLSDYSFRIGNNPSVESYLLMDDIIKIAKDNKIDAIHPGYGFFSENYLFVEKCFNNNINFIGPSTDSMKKMGSKSLSKEIMIQNNVPVLDGYQGDNQDPQYLLEQAKKIGFPVIIKAVLGGGGKGMRMCTKESEFLENLEIAKREAISSFNDDRVIIERFILNPKHIEVQIIGDKHGNVFQLFERDCSIQRRHQKVIEEAPSNLDSKVIEEIRNSAIIAAKSVDYFNAGTVEFLYDTDKNDFAFMEMNTRLQVEHPVTEKITGVDLVELQLKVAQGEKLDLSYIKNPIGHSIEARICCEDTFNNFLPNIGKFKKYKKPELNENVRLDDCVQEGYELSAFYDSMIGKLITHGKNREEAIKHLNNSLDQFNIRGLANNLNLVKNIINEKDFKDFNYKLDYLEIKKDEIIKVNDLNIKNIISSAIKLFSKNKIENSFVNMRINNKIKKNIDFQLKLQDFKFNLETKLYQSIIQEIDNNKYNLFIKLEENILFNDVIEIIENNDYNLKYLFNNQTYQQKFDCDNENIYLVENNLNFKLVNENFRGLEVEELGMDSELLTPMPGVIKKIYVKENQIIKKNELIAVMEAMKMELKINAPFDLKVNKILYKLNDFVSVDQHLIEYEKI